MKIGFIGTGVMGKSMATHLGETLFIYNRTKEKALPLIEQGHIWCDTPAEVVAQSDIIFTMLGYPIDVEAIYLGPEGLISNGTQDQIFIDCTTSSPELAQKINQEASNKGIYVLDAPVSGGDIGARNGTLSVMVGGDEAILDRVKPLIDKFSSSVTYFGEAGSGQHTKMANQIAIATNMIGVAESLYYAHKAGLDVEKVLETISKGAAGSWSLSNLAPRILKEDYAPGFYTHHFLKDMSIALEETKKLGIELPGLELSYKLYSSLSDELKESTGTHAIYQYYTQA
ncbi:NAD(P)-dependent oxidoreductase [Macrococcoides canis]|uniref:NAD(P)-dependent oxidoreductase n=1 Tax=Macrococcoides canis TaxID=1855823 RepID=UPI0010FC1F2B|nr:NAD(P)-dependent oxidoreductase [Macrococcus canis]QCT73907.1 NAD(P)-dependent oxidoreductase [Macrococcus canis]QTQ08319.1 NAD(P)-dependent oxidoreductase [Macrococcus canis]UTH07073.1 NAD(P)-dependent oxidoreductase [Macrococcus canis]